MKNPISSRLSLDMLSNTRDLGGMIGADGRKIMPGRLVRSGQLFFASEKDLKALSAYGIKRVYDFRREQECEEKPDSRIPGSEYIHLPVLKAKAMGISREKDANNKLFSLIEKYGREDKEFGQKHMCRIYESLMKEEFTRNQYGRFLDGLLQVEEGAVLWHCTAGKDRAGFATVLVEEILGVSKEDIMGDYMYTNECLAQEVEMLLDQAGQKLDMSQWREPCRDMFIVRESYLNHLYRLIEDTYGGMSAFITQGLGFSEDKQARMRDLYLSR